MPQGHRFSISTCYGWHQHEYTALSESRSKCHFGSNLLYRFSGRSTLRESAFFVTFFSCASTFKIFSALSTWTQKCFSLAIFYKWPLHSLCAPGYKIYEHCNMNHGSWTQKCLSLATFINGLYIHCVSHSLCYHLIVFLLLRHSYNNNNNILIITIRIGSTTTMQ